MFQLFTGAVTLFFQGRLFADRHQAYKRIACAIALAAAAGSGLVLAGLPLWFATIGGGVIGGAAAPALCINLRMQ